MVAQASKPSSLPLLPASEPPAKPTKVGMMSVMCSLFAAAVVRQAKRDWQRPLLHSQAILDAAVGVGEPAR